MSSRARVYTWDPEAGAFSLLQVLIQAYLFTAIGMIKRTMRDGIAFCRYPYHHLRVQVLNRTDAEGGAVRDASALETIILDIRMLLHEPREHTR